MCNVEGRLKGATRGKKKGGAGFFIKKKEKGKKGNVT